MQRAVFRIIDANFNRAREALRVMEEFCRFALNSTRLSSRTKQLRHDLCLAISRLDAGGKLLASRDTPGDVGTDIKLDRQLGRADLKDSVTAASNRLTEALRTLAETIQTFDRPTAQAIENLRYLAYTLQKDILISSDVREKFKRVRLYLIISSDLPIDVIRLVDCCAAGGADCIQLRAKRTNDDTTFALARQVVGLCKEAGIISIINDRADIAVAAGADGVHLGQNDLPIAEAHKLQLTPLIFGASTHSVAELKRAIEQGADYVGVGPVFPTGTKPKVQAVGLDYVRQAAALAKKAGIVPVAIGGITLQNVDDVLAAGAEAIAVCSAVANAPDPTAASRKLKEKITAYSK